jgi:sugar O-acyltransferase (sialic acid O-acetyltransferase NeuD family)
MSKNLRIFGAGVRASCIMDLIHWQLSDRFAIEGYYDDRIPAGTRGPGGKTIFGPVEQGIEEATQLGFTSFVALGSKASEKTCQVFLRLKENQCEIASLIAPGTCISPSAVIGQNALIMPGVYIGCEVVIGHIFIAYGGCTVEHHNKIGHNVTLGPGVTVAGCAQINSHCFIGAGSIMVPETKVGTGSYLGAGCLVIEDIPPHTVAYGHPAVGVRAVHEGDEVPVAPLVRQLAGQGLD